MVVVKGQTSIRAGAGTGGAGGHTRGPLARAQEPDLWGSATDGISMS